MTKEELRLSLEAKRDQVMALFAELLVQVDSLGGQEELDMLRVEKAALEAQVVSLRDRLSQIVSLASQA